MGSIPIAYMIRRSDGEVHWDEVDCLFREESEAEEVARLMTDNDPDGYSFGALPLYDHTN